MWNNFIKYLMLAAWILFTGCLSEETSDSIIRAPDFDGSPDGVSSFAVEIDENSITDVNSINASAYVITGICEIGAGDLLVTVSSPIQTENTPCVGGTFSVTFNLTSLSSSSVSIVAEQNGETDAPDTAPTNDQTSAAVTLDSSPDVDYNNYLSYSPSGHCSEEGQQVTVVVGGVPASPQPNCAGGQWSVIGINLSGTANGPLQITVDHSDSLGNPASQVTRTIYKDVETPSIITAPSAPNDPNWSLNLRPGDLPNLTATNSNSFRFTGYCRSGGGDVNIIFGSLSFLVPCNDFFGFYEYTADVSSEVSSNPIQHCATQGTSPVICANPITNELAPPGMSFDSSPLDKIGSSNELNYLLRGSCAPEGASITIDIGSEIGILSGTCNSSSRFLLSGDLSSLPDSLSLPVTGIISVGGGGSASISSTVTKGVLVSLDAPQNILMGNVNSYSLSGSCSENNRDVHLNIGGYVPAAPLCEDGNWNIDSLDLSSLSEGSLLITVDHMDDVGNPAVQVSVNIAKDVTAPTVLFSSNPNIILANQTNYSVSGSCSEEGLEVNLDLGGFIPAVQPVCSSGLWGLTGLDLSSLPVGSTTFTAYQVDLAGNQTSVDVSLNKDTIAPTVTVDVFSNISSINESSYSLSGSCSEDGQEVILSVGGLSPLVSVFCSSSSWSLSGMDVSSIGAGSVLITADHQDSSGNPALQNSVNVIKADPIQLTLSNAGCSSIYVDFSSYSFLGSPAHSYDSTSGDLSVSGVSNWQTLVSQTALPDNFEITFTLNGDGRQMVGFTGSPTPSTTWTGLESIMLFYDNTSTYFYGNGSFLGSVLDSVYGGFPADVRIAKLDGTARYYVNGLLIHTDSTIPTGVPMYLAFAGVTGYTSVYSNIQVRDLSIQDGYFIAGSFIDPNGDNSPYEIYDVTNDTVVGTVGSNFEIEYNTGLNSSANIVVRSVASHFFSSLEQTISLSDCLKPIVLNISAASCFGPTESVLDYTFSGDPASNYEAGTDTFTVTGAGYWRTLAAQEPLPEDFSISFTINSDVIQFVGFSATSTPSTTWTGLESSLLFYTNGFTYFYSNGSYQGNVADSSFGGFPANVIIEKIGSEARFYINNNLVRTDSSIAGGDMYLTFSGGTASDSASYQALTIEDLSSAAAQDYKIFGSFEDPNGVSPVDYELYDVTNDIVIGTVSSPFEVDYDSGLNSSANIVIRRQGTPNTTSLETSVNLSTCP